MKLQRLNEQAHLISQQNSHWRFKSANELASANKQHSQKLRKDTYKDRQGFLTLHKSLNFVIIINMAQTQMETMA